MAYNTRRELPPSSHPLTFAMRVTKDSGRRLNSGGISGKFCIYLGRSQCSENSLLFILIWERFLGVNENNTWLFSIATIDPYNNSPPRAILVMK